VADLTNAVRDRRQFQCGYLEPYDVDEKLGRRDGDYDTASELLAERVDAAVTRLLDGAR
jgi:hypothetical protein